MSEAKAAFDFASKLQAFAESQGVHVSSIRASRYSKKYDALSVLFKIKSKPPVRETTEKEPVETTVEPDDTTTGAQIDEPVGTVNLETVISELEKELDHNNDAESVEKEV